MNKRGFSSLEIIFVVIAIVIVGSSIFYLTGTKFPINPPSQPITDKTNEPIVITQTNRPNNQIVYKIDDYGLEFTLPATLVRQPQPSNTYYVNDLFFAKGPHNETFRIYTNLRNGSAYTKLNIEKVGYIKNINDSISSTFVRDPWDVVIGNKKGEKFYVQGEICTPSQNIQVDVKNSSGKNQTLVVSFWGGYCDREGLDQNAVDLVLASFKFSK